MEGSRRYSRWDAGLYSPEAWSQRRDSWFAERGLPGDGAAFVAGLKDDVHETTLAVANRFPANTEVRVEGGRLALEALEAVEIPPFAEEIRQALVGMLPLVSLPELLLEVDRWTSFSKDLLHLTARGEPSPRHVAATRPALFAVILICARPVSDRKQFISDQGTAGGRHAPNPRCHSLGDVQGRRVQPVARLLHPPGSPSPGVANAVPAGSPRWFGVMARRNGHPRGDTVSGVAVA